MIGYILQTKREVAQVNLKKNCLGDKGIMVLAECLTNSKICVEIHHNDSEFGSCLSNREILGNINGEKLHDESFDGKIYLPKSEIVNLEIGENEITHIGAKYLFEALAIN